VFTVWTTSDILVRHARIDSSDNVIIDDASFLFKLNPSTNELTTWNPVKAGEDMNVDGFGNFITTVDSASDVGDHTAIAIGSDNLPVIAYRDKTNADLKVVHCGNVSCSSGNTITTVDSIGALATTQERNISIAIGSDSLPVISYFDDTANDLKVVHCGNVSCSSGNTITNVDSTDNVGKSTSIAIGSDNLPVISYHDATNNDLKVVHCGNVSCSSGNTITAVDSTGSDVGRFTSIAIGSDNLPVISYFDFGNGLKVAHCGNVSCSSGNTITAVDSKSTSTGLHTSIAIGSDNLPIISYLGDSTLKVTHCGNVSCSSGNTITTVDGIVTVGLDTAIAIGSDNLPVISYFDAGNVDLKVVHCGNISCSSGNTIDTLDSIGEVGDDTSIAIGSDNLPVISYFDNKFANLKVVHCADASCSPGNAYMTTQGGGIGSGGTIQRLDLGAGTLTEWSLSIRPAAITTDSSGNIFFTATDGIRGKVGRINPSDNTLTEWIIPNSSTGTISEIAVDSAGTVYFHSGGLVRFVPSTEVFTFFTEINTCIFLIEIDSSDNVHCSSGSAFSEIT